jgi:hypothetical protein
MSKDSWDNYKGLQVPPKHGDLFRAMDQQKRFYAEIMKMNEVSIQNAFNQAKPKVIAKLNVIKNNHLIVFNSKVLNEILSKIKIGNSSDIDFLSKGDVTVDLSSYYLLGNSEIFKSIKLQIPHFFKDYKDIYNGISSPFNKVIDDLLKTTSQVELHSIKNDFLQNLNHLNAYFEYSEGNNCQSLISEITCKESLIQVVDDIILKLESFNKAQNELEIQSIDEEDIVSNVSHLSDNSNLNFQIIPPLILNQSQPNQPIVNEQPLTELEKALAEIKALKEANAAKDLKIANMVSREEVEHLISENRENIQKMGEKLTEIRQENAEKNSVIAEKDITNKIITTQYTGLENQFNMLKDEHYEAKETIKDLRNDKNKLNNQVDKLEKEVVKWKLSVKVKDEELIKLQNDNNSSQNSWSHLEKKSSSSKSSVYKAKIKKLEEENGIFKSIFVEQNQKIELNKLLPENIENTFFQFEEINKIDIAGEIHHD